LSRSQGIKESRIRARKGPSPTPSGPLKAEPCRRHNPRTPEPPNPVLIGIGGNAGSGKSTFVKELARLGAKVIDADRIGWELLKRGTPTARQVLREFGLGVLGSRGAIDRRKLGAIVFARPSARRRLNRIVHPALLREIERRIGALRRNSEIRNLHSAIRIVVLDAALLFFWNWQHKVDIAVLVSASRANKLRRLVGQGLTLTEARHRLASQLTEPEMRRKADLTIPNNGTVADLRVRARRFYRLLKAEL
jgi:dephospho-CoA kinase